MAPVQDPVLDDAGKNSCKRWAVRTRRPRTPAASAWQRPTSGSS